MQSLKDLRTASTLKALKAQGLSNRDIMDLSDSEGWEATQALVEKEVK
jgi:hypothetical protein